MAGRFVFQKLSSPMARSRSLLGAHAPAAAKASAPATRTTSEAGVGTLSNLFHGATGHETHGYVARHFNTIPCSRPAAKTSCTATGMPSIIINCSKPFSTKAGRAALDEMAAKDDMFWREIMWFVWVFLRFLCFWVVFGGVYKQLQGPKRFSSLHKLQQRQILGSNELLSVGLRGWSKKLFSRSRSKVQTTAVCRCHPLRNKKSIDSAESWPLLTLRQSVMHCLL